MPSADKPSPEESIAADRRILKTLEMIGGGHTDLWELLEQQYDQAQGLHNNYMAAVKKWFKGED